MSDWIEQWRGRESERERKQNSNKQSVNGGECMENHCTAWQLLCRFEIFPDKKWGGG